MNLKYMNLKDMHSMCTASATTPAGVSPFLCHDCAAGVDDATCPTCGWTTCACEGCRQYLRLERNALHEFDVAAGNGMLAVGCSGHPAPPIPVAPIAEEEPASPPAAPPVSLADDGLPPFRNLLRMCGLSLKEAAKVLGQSESSMKKKSAGLLAMTMDDRVALALVWDRIRRGDLDKLPAGAREAAAALRTLSGE